MAPLSSVVCRGNDLKVLGKGGHCGHVCASLGRMPGALETRNNLERLMAEMGGQKSEWVLGVWGLVLRKLMQLTLLVEKGGNMVTSIGAEEGLWKQLPS